MSKCVTLAQLKSLLKHSVQASDQEVLLGELHSDTRLLQQGDVFVAIQAHGGHRLDFLAQALQRQPSVILSSQPLSAEQETLLAAHQAQFACVFVYHEALETELAQVAAAFYAQPSQQLKVIGITGTNGKTSTANYLAQLLELLGHKTALIGTLGIGQVGALVDMGNTTPDVVRLHRYLYEFWQQGFEYVVMEVSSHAIVEQRIAQVAFDLVALTQVTQDHLDFHGSEAAYRQAKAELFLSYPSNVQLLNLNDSLGQSLYQRLQEQGRCVFAYQSCAQLTDSDDASLLRAAVAIHSTGLSLRIQDTTVSLPLLGRFNADNALCALQSLHALGFDVKDVLPLAAQLKPVLGRMEIVATAPNVVIDFAHTEDALAQVLQAMRQHQAQTGQLWVVFGCGGDRDASKRPRMGAVAQAYADRVVITSDNPRSESPEQIMAQICQGISTLDDTVIESNRHKAIEYALSTLKPEDSLLIAGKGHEAYQEIQGVKYPYSDFAVVAEYRQAQK